MQAGYITEYSNKAAQVVLGRRLWPVEIRLCSCSLRIVKTVNAQLRHDSKYRLLRCLPTRKPGGGFTLIELLVVVVIAGILSAAAVPNLLGQIGKARQTEGEVAIGTFLRAQKAFFLENGTFETSITSTDDLLEGTNPLGIALSLDVYAGGSISSTVDETTIALGDPATTAALGVRLLEGELEFDFDSAVFLQVICQSVDVVDPQPPSADPSTSSGTPSCGANGMSI